MAEHANTTSKPKDAKPFDAMDPWRGMRDAYLETWAKTMVDMVNSEAYSQAAGSMLDTYLAVSAPFRDAVEKAMLKTLEQLAMPSRNDVISIAERMTNIEMRLDDLDAKIEEIHKMVAGATAARTPAAAPRRVTTPAKSKSSKRRKK